MKAVLFILLLAAVVFCDVQQLETNQYSALLAIKTALGHDAWTSVTRKAELQPYYDTTWNTAINVCGSGSQYTGSWFGVLCNSAGNVEVLLLARNNLIGTLPDLISKLTQLKQFYLQANTISGTIPLTSAMTSLTHLYIWDNKLTSVVNIASTNNLQRFYFERNLVADSTINWITTLPNILEISAADNLITATIPNAIQSASLLRKLDFRRNKLSGTLPYNLMTHPSMVFIYLGDNLLTGQIPSGVDIGAMNLKLQNIDLARNNLRCLVPNWITILSIPVDITGNNFFCPVPVPTFSLVSTPTNCVSVTQTGASPTNIDLFTGPGTSFTIYGTNFGFCTSGTFECKWIDQVGGAKTIVTATSVTSTSITCPIPSFAVGGGRFVCVSQGGGTELASNCTFINTFFDCSTKCKNGGFCNTRTGQCICNLNWKGPTCEDKNCGFCNEPNGYCDSVTGLCVCDDGWLGPNCNFGNLPCNNVCVHGSCNGFTGSCVCEAGFQGDDCNTVYCPPCNPVGGVCVHGNCSCFQYWTGLLCNVPTKPCPGDGTCGSGIAPPRGRCDHVSGECVCYPGWQGTVCDEKPCPLNCSYPNGLCDKNTGTCVCEGYYALPTCIVQNIPCPNGCSGNGVCTSTTGVCQCKYPYQPDDCSEAICNPPDCSGHGTCDTAIGVCDCTFPYTGAACSVPNATCPNDCSGVGSCDRRSGECYCPIGYNTTVGDCSTKVCPGDGTCGAHGDCDFDTGICGCEPNWVGGTCATPDHDCLDNCNGNGFCDRRTGICTCSVGFVGDSCTERTCNNNCTYPNGDCDTKTGKCKCDDDHEGDDCSLLTCHMDCLNGGGCDNTQGTCACGSQFRGDNCALIACPDDCYGNGQCVGGVCFCDKLWTGENCSQAVPDYGKIALVVCLCILGGIVLIGIIFAVWRQVMIARLTAQLNNGGGGGGGDMDISDS